METAAAKARARGRHPLLTALIPVVEGLGKTFGRYTEVVLHDISDPEHSIIAIANGEVSGRTLGGPMTEVGLKMIRASQGAQDILNYGNYTRDGRKLKSSTILLRDETGQVIGCLCINVDLTEMSAAERVLQEYCRVEEGGPTETLATSVNDVLEHLVEQAVADVGKAPAHMTREEKIQVVKTLEKQGAFLIRGAAEYIAKTLGVSRYTVYNYLD
jgi:predicted transcriptional regulator YheO